MSCAGVERKTGLSDGKVRENFLEAYANAVRMYQNIVLELQDPESQDAATRGSILKRAEAAKETVKYYRSAFEAAAVS